MTEPSKEAREAAEKLVRARFHSGDCICDACGEAQAKVIQSAIAEAEERGRAESLEKLKTWIGHVRNDDSECAWFNDEDCDCGLDAARRELEGRE